jgi:hypothetical protein
MMTSSRIRECIEYLTLAYYDLSKYPKNDKYHWIIKNQISDREFELESLLTDVDLYEAAYARRVSQELISAGQEPAPQPPAA